MAKSYSSESNRDDIKPIFEERFKEILGDDYDKFVKTILTPQRKSFRINSLKAKNSTRIIESIKNKGIHITKVPWCENSFFVDFDKESRTDLGNLIEHFNGEIYIQEATSMIPPELIDIPEKIDDKFKVLDMAAAPGSKTTQIAEKMKNRGIIIANELDYSRLGPLKMNLERAGIINSIITNGDGRKITGEESFDRILLDAPCSGSGVIRKSPRTLKTYNPKKLKGMKNLQKKLLSRAFELLKRRGIMVYSTCSLDPEENEICIKEFLEENPNASIETININMKRTNLIKKFNNIEIPKIVYSNTLRVWPQDNDTNGFFVAKIRKD